MPIPLILTKLHRPPVAKDHLHRQHLLERLTDHQHRPLTLVSAPAGYGKTTLVSSWLEVCDCPNVWVSLDSGESDLRTFLVYFLAAVDSIFSGTVTKTQALLKGSDLPPEDLLFATLVNELYAIDENYIIVLDDYHNIRSKEVHDFINQLLIHPPPASMHLTLVTRRDPPFSYMNLRSSGQMTEIRMQQLRFSESETYSYLSDVMKMDLDPQTATLIAAKTEGWAAGLRLASLSLRERSERERIVANLPENNRYVMDYIISEVIAQQSPEIQDYLLSSSILDRFCAPLCDAICISQNESVSCSLTGQAFIEYIEENNMFCIPLDDSRDWFRFHHLFRQLLHSELKRLHGKKALLDLHNQAGLWLAQHGLPDEALEHLLSAQNIEAAGRLVVSHRYDLTRQEQWYRLNRWIEVLPREAVDNDPELLIIKAWIHENRERYPEMSAALDRVEQLLADGTAPSGSTEAIQGELYALRAAVLLYSGDTARASKSADQAVALIPLELLSERAFALIVWAFAYQMEGNADEARKFIYRSMKADATQGSTYFTRLQLALCFLDWLEGNLDGLLQNAKQLLSLSHTHDLVESKTFAKYFLGVVNYCMGEYDRAIAHLEPAVVAGRMVDPNTYVHGNCALALAHQAKGQSEKADAIVKEMIGYAAHANNPGLIQIMQAFNAEVSFRQGRLGQAVSWAREYDLDPLSQVFRFFAPQLTQAKALLLAGKKADRVKAHALLDRMIQFFRAQHNNQILIELYALQAIYFKIEGDQAAAMEMLSAALDLADQSRRKQPFLSLGDKMAELLKRVGRKGQYGEYIRELLAAFDTTALHLPQEGGISDPDHPPELIDRPEPLENPLTNRELDIVHLLTRRLSNKEIATRLFISPETVKRHTVNIYKKLSTHNRQEAVARAKALGLVQ